MKLKWILLIAFISPLLTFSQRITYSETEREDTKAVNFEVIGKISGNFLVYKNIRFKHAISVYDNDMGLIERVDLDFIPDKTFNIDFIAFPDFSYLIYQFQKRSIVHCMLAKVDGAGKKIGEPVELDTTFINVFADNKIYSLVNSDDKQKVMLYKIQKKNDNFNFTTLLFNSQFQLQHKSRITMPYDDRKDVLNDFAVDNDGNFVFSKSVKTGARELINKLSLVYKAPLADAFSVNDLNLSDHYLDEVKLKVDNINQHYILNSFYYKARRSNIEGLYTAVWDKQTQKQIAENVIPFSDSLRYMAKKDGASKVAFNDFFLKNLILKKDGGFILTGENYYTQSRGNTWNRMDYLYGYPYVSSYDYYMYSSSYYRSRNFYNNGSQTRYYYENILVMNLDNTGKLVWSNVIHKDQFDDDSDNLLSYQIYNAGGELHFLFNELERKNQLIADQTVTPDGNIIRNPTLKSQDKGYEFMPRFAKQVSSKQIIIPCTYRNYICFAKIDY